MKTFRHLKRAALIGALIPPLAACGSSSGGSAHQAAPSFNYGVFSSPTMIEAGIAQGKFSNIKAHFQNIDSGPAALPLITNGRLAGIDDVSSPPVAIALAQNVGVKIVWMNHVESDALVVKSGIHTAADLVGKKVAVATGSVSELLMDQYLQANGIAVNRVNIVNVPPPSMPAAFKSGQVDAAYIWSPIYPEIVADGGKVLHKTSDPTYVLVGSDFIKSHSSVVQTFVCDLAATWRSFSTDPASSYKAMASRIGVTAATAKQLLPANSLAPIHQAVPQWLGSSSAPSQQAKWVADTAKWLATSGKISSAPSLQQVQGLFDPTFAAYVAAGKCK